MHEKEIIYHSCSDARELAIAKWIAFWYFVQFYFEVSCFPLKSKCSQFVCDVISFISLLHLFPVVHCNYFIMLL